MKLRTVVLLCPAILTASLCPVDAQPLVKFTVRSYNDVNNIISTFAKNLNPKSTKDYALEFSNQLGVTNLTTFNPQKSWEVAVWYEGGISSPLIALKGPIKDISEFKDSLNPDGNLRKQGKEWSQLENGVGLITFGNLKPDDLSDAAKKEFAELDQWKKEPLPSPGKMVELNLNLSEPIRQQLSGFIGIGRMSLIQSMNSAQSIPGGNPKAMTEIFNAYFDFINVVVAGFQDLKLAADVQPEALIIDKRLTAKPGSELAQWMQKPANPITATELSGLDSDAFLSFAGSIGKNESMMKWMDKFTMLGFQMQSSETNETDIKEIHALLEKCLPMKFAGSAYMKDKLTFTGSYRFPASKASDVYSEMKQFLNSSFKKQVGEGKIYSSAELVEKHHTENGIPVDRFSATINMKHPLYSMPGQKEQLEAFWPGGKLEFDYAVKNDQLFFASAGQMKSLLENNNKTAPKFAFKLEDGTCLAGYFNFLSMVSRITQANPMFPEEMKQKLSKLDSKGSSIEYQMSIDKQMHSETRIPMKIVRELGSLK